MQYKKYTVGPYNLHIIKTNKFKKVRMHIYFKRLVKKDEITKRVVLSNILFESSKSYKNKKDMSIAAEDLYSLNGSGQATLSGNYSLLQFNLSFLNEKYTEVGMNEKSFHFLMDILFNPNVISKSFDDKSLKLVKNNIEQLIKGVIENPAYYSRLRILEEMGSKEAYSFHPDGYIEDLNKIDSKNLYEYYLDVLRSDLVDIFICGDVDLDSIKNIISKYFKVNTIKKQGPTHFIEHKRVRSRNKSIKESKDIKQSQLVIGYKLLGLTEFERNYVLPMYSYILGGSADSKLFKEVREKNSLCYTVNSSILQIPNLMIISAGIDKKNYRKALTLIKKQVMAMHKGEFKDEDLDNGKLSYINSLKEIMDSPRSIINHYVVREYLNGDLMEERLKKIKNVNKDMIIKFSNKLFLDTVFLLEGTNEEV